MDHFTQSLKILSVIIQSEGTIHRPQFENKFIGN